VPVVSESRGEESGVLPAPGALRLRAERARAAAFGHALPGSLRPRLVPPRGDVQAAVWDGRGFSSRRGSLNTAFWHDDSSPPASGRVGSALWERVVSCGEDSPSAALPVPRFARSAVPTRSSPAQQLLLSLCVRLLSPRVSAPAACCPLPALSRCLSLTDCAVSVCLYLSLTRTTKQRYAHLSLRGVCLLVNDLCLHVLERGRSPGAAPWPEHPVLLRRAAGSATRWALGKGLTFQHRSGLPARCLPLRQLGPRKRGGLAWESGSGVLAPLCGRGERISAP